MNPKFLLIFLLPLLFSCNSKTKTLFTLLHGSETGISFQNTVIENEQFNLYDFHNVYNGAGVAVGDLNSDNLPDLYFTGNMSGDRIYINISDKEKGSLKFQDITDQAGIIKRGWSTGVTLADVNADGLLDIYVCKSGNYTGDLRANQLYINQGVGQNGIPAFKEMAQDFGLADTTYSSQAAFFDYDKDGDLDMYLLTTTNVIRNPNRITIPVNDGTGYSNDKLFQNDGDAKFTEVTKKAGILHDGNGLGLSICDIDNDGWEDIFVSNDFLPNDLLYINNHDGTFKEMAKEYLKHHSRFSMGNDVADFNNDGRMDIMTVDMLPANNEQRKMMTGPGNFEQYEVELNTGYHSQFMRNMLHINLGKTPEGRVLFSEIGQIAGVHSSQWSWAPLFADFDNDGLKDLFISNGYLRDITNLDFISYNVAYEERNLGNLRRYMIDRSLELPSWNDVNCFFKNRGDLTFEDATKQWFGDSLSVSNGAAYADLDNDGDLDLVINNTNKPAYVMRNDAPRTNFLKIQLKGTPKNIHGLGSEITIYAKGVLQKYHQAVTKGYASSVDYIIHFGLGSNTKIDSLEVVWTDGKTQKLKNIGANQTLKLDYINSTANNKSVDNPEPTLLADVTSSVNISFKSEEERYVDYNVETLLLHKLSQQGPKMTVGDINGDGLDDFFVGGSYKNYGKFFVQTPVGLFIQKSYINESLPKGEEDIEMVLFDADSDKDLDLYIVSGSNEYPDGSNYYQDRLYLNDGKGNFTDATNQLPSIRHSGSCVAVADYDKDGDLDIFRGGRLTPLQYPQSGDSYLFKNDYGIFSDYTTQTSAELAKIGMVTDAIWIDVDNDTWLDLVVVGEFMPVTVFKNIQGKLSKSGAFPDSEGFWNTVSAADFDKDGDIDLVLGNLGLNSRYKCSKNQPLTVYGADYDDNGRWDAIPSYFINGKEHPIPTRDYLLRQLPLFRKKFQNYASYAKATMKDVLTDLQMKQAIIKKAYVQESMYAENLGSGLFALKPLPQMAQWAPVQSMLIDDVNHDGNLDIMIVGNAYDAEPIAGKYDAFVGLILMGDGKGGFNAELYDKTGFVVDGDCKDIITVKTASKNRLYVVSQNKASLKLFKSK
ncbi:VCBS repeat-containing protein [Emticicia sp. BO119]|uniref:VCBS repeat-containing protein n=1 Tax=Emticicia sp. BO119 TaxID=2757768 RepID=UPI0015F10950|nr:VCBS repeat-containing protein [Emticicia sp. BO119]MBA4852704.1 VCBS repeat-containing protein [Emticicia sp. BO119]